MKKRLGCTKG